MIDSMTSAARELGLSAESTEGRNPFVPLGVSWEKFQQDQSKNFRKMMRKKQESLENQGRYEVHHEVAPSWHRMQQTVLSVSRESWQGNAGRAIGSTDEGIEFYRTLCEPNDTFEVHLTSVTSDRLCIAYLVGLVHQGVYYAFDTGYLPEYAHLSPGLVVHYAVLRELCNRQIRELDFGFDASYKDRFAPQYRVYHDVKVFPDSARMWAWRLAHRVRQRRSE
ncbi:MAG TPA: GNAT family N-acetyltransferase [Gemmatimonadales bacterium]|nr:GNAT family N-acetyltransferase [Gemmatimonadales bacterium]